VAARGGLRRLLRLRLRPVRLNSLHTGSAQAFGLKVLGVGLFTLYSILLARTLSPNDYGTFMYAVALLTAAGGICLLGFDTTAMKFAAVYWVENDRRHLAGLLRKSRLVAFAVSLSVVALAGALLILSVLDHTGGVGRAILLSLPALPLWTLVVLHREFLRGLGFLGRALLGFQILRPGIALVLTATAALVWPLTAAQVMALFILALAVAVGVDTLQIGRLLGRDRHRPTYEHRRWNRTARPLALSKLTNVVLARADILMVGALLTMTDAGRYAAAYRLAALTAFVLDAVRLVIAPHISEIFHRGDRKALQTQVTQASRLIFLATLPPALLLLIFPKFFLGFFGPEYESANVILVFLVLGQLFNAMAGTVGVLLTMTDYQRAHAMIVGTTAGFYVILNFFLIRSMGAEGAALATTLTMGVSNIWMAIVVRKKLKIVSYITPSRVFWSGLLGSDPTNGKTG
jgi:O-antigen/teichoic acid export membrane protein